MLLLNLINIFFLKQKLTVMTDAKIKELLESSTKEDPLFVDFSADYVELKSFPKIALRQRFTISLFKNFDEEVLRSVINGDLPMEQWTKEYFIEHEQRHEDIDFDALIAEGNNYVCKASVATDDLMRHIKVKRSVVELLLQIEEKTGNTRFAYKVLFIGPRIWIDHVFG